MITIDIVFGAARMMSERFHTVNIEALTPCGAVLQDDSKLHSHIRLPKPRALRSRLVLEVPYRLFGKLTPRSYFSFILSCSDSQRCLPE